MGIINGQYNDLSYKAIEELLRKWLHKKNDLVTEAKIAEAVDEMHEEQRGLDGIDPGLIARHDWTAKQYLNKRRVPMAGYVPKSKPAGVWRGICGNINS